jgi:hypothetical protein
MPANSEKLPPVDLLTMIQNQRFQIHDQLYIK